MFAFRLISRRTLSLPIVQVGISGLKIFARFRGRSGFEIIVGFFRCPNELLLFMETIRIQPLERAAAH